MRLRPPPRILSKLKYSGDDGNSGDLAGFGAGIESLQTASRVRQAIRATFSLPPKFGFPERGTGPSRDQFDRGR